MGLAIAHRQQDNQVEGTQLETFFKDMCHCLLSGIGEYEEDEEEETTFLQVCESVCVGSEWVSI